MTDVDEEYLGLPVSVKAAPADGIGLVDWTLSGLLTAAVAGLMMFWSFPGIYPDAWNDIAIAAGIRPATAVAPGIWHLIATGLFRGIGLSAGVTVLKIAGPAFNGVCAGMAYLLLREMLALTSRLRLQYSPQRFLIARLSSFLGALFFACSDPVWRAGQLFAPVTLMLFLSVLGVLLFFAFLRCSRLSVAYGSMLVLGILSAETPMGVILVVFCLGVYFLAARHVLSLDMPLMNPFVGQISKWHMTFLFVLGFFAAVALNCFSFNMHGGVAGGSLPGTYALRMWSLMLSAASPLGWIIAIGIVLLPCGVSASLLPRAVDEEQFLPYHIGALFLATALLTFAQLASFDPLWMWTWSSEFTLFSSNYLLCLLMLLAAATVTFGLVVLGVDTFCRNHRRLAIQMFAEIQIDDDEKQMLASKRFLSTLRRTGLFVLPLVLAAGVVPGRMLTAARQMSAIVDDYVNEVCEECGDVRWVFTDGVFDTAIEVVSAMRGHGVNALSFMDGNSPREVGLRMRGGVDAEDALAMRCGAATVLRTWVKDKPERLAASALQLGLDAWKREGKTPPPCSGVLCRPSGMDEAARSRGIEAAKSLAQRILDVYRHGGRTSAAGTTINRLFIFAQWRLARMMRLRAEHADASGKPEEAQAEIKMADELDSHNSAVRNIRDNMERMRQLTMSKMTPREGLQLALVRADFALARKYAEPVLEADPSDANANFGMGMSYYAEQQWSQAEVYLRRCLLRNPKEPAVYNNLAVVQLMTGRYEAALGNARKALALSPGSAEIEDTIQQIEKARALAGKGDGRGKDETNKDGTKK